MIRWTSLLGELIISAIVFAICYKVLWNRYSKGTKIIIIVLSFCAVFCSFSAASFFNPSKRTIVITATGEKNENAESAHIYLTGFELDGVKQGVPSPVSGQWSWIGEKYCWFEKDDERHETGMTDSVTFEIETAEETKVIFLGNEWKGKALIQIGGQKVTADTYMEGKDGKTVSILLPAPSAEQIRQAILSQALGFTLALLLLCMTLTALIVAAKKAAAALVVKLSGKALFKKLLGYQFLFEELVARDFKKKYKRTVLGMAWSVLSPVLTLLVMRIVFTQFFGRNTAHYTTYLFCGNLVFSYFNDSTKQGMTALMGNASIFTRVNVPKYLFLFSKNVQTLMNFGLTLIVFFIFCIIDNITFTWKFILLIYPIVTLLLFNIGMGLILSALFVFFRDVQYLWSVFTQLLMYLSAVYYTIDRYSPAVQNLFLLNPVYLHIRYFRKIVIEATIPTLQFHLLMLADVLIVLCLGCWMYKKYNTRFLYYV